MIVVPYQPAHILTIDLQEQQRNLISHICMEYLARLEAIGPAMTALENDKVIACAGVAYQGFGLGMLWAFVSKDAGKHFVRLDRYTRRLLEIPKLRRIEATTEVTFRQGCRWLELLGFQQEGIMRKFGGDGSDHYRYAKVA